MDTTPPPSFDNPLVEGPSPGTLRALRDRAHAALAEQRERMHRLESQLSKQLEVVAEELAADDRRSSESDAVTAAREALARERADWEAEQALADVQLTERLEDLSSRLAELTVREEQFEEQRAAFAAREQQHAEQATALEERQTALTTAEAELAERREELDRQHGAKETEFAGQRDAFASEREAFEQQQRQAAQDVDGRIAELNEQLEAQATAHREEVESLRREHDELVDERDRLRIELEAQASELAESRDRLETVEATQLETQIVEEEKRTALARENEQLTAELAELREQQATRHEDWDQERERLVAERDEALEHAKGADATQERAAKLDEVERKFHLALEDLRTLRERNAELEQELARRPEQAESESTELVELRQERDCLIARVTELENLTPIVGEQSGAEEFANLQRRFEMAVDDVRQLRKDNEALAEKLAAAGRRPAAAADDPGDMGWEAQKRRLLASLENEGDDVPAARTEERAKIEGTIRITDDVVAAKDREIAALERQLQDLAAQNSKAPAAVDEQLQEAINADDVIRQHREKLASLEAELTDKLRRTELELSVERAKLARDQADLAERQNELEKLRDSLPQSDSGGSANAGSGKGKGRWFSKLGLGGDE